MRWIDCSILTIERDACKAPLLMQDSAVAILQQLASFLLQVEEGLRFEDCFTDCRIWFEYEGSDHAPVWADLQLPEPLPRGVKPPSLDVRNRQSSSGESHSPCM